MSWDKELKIKQVDAIIRSLRPEKIVSRPKGGWLKLVRTTLGMSARSLGERVGLTQSRIAYIEKGEEEGSITLNTLEKVAEGLGCEVVYYLVPKERSLEKIRQKQAYRKAANINGQVEVHMSLEDQSTSKEFQNRSISKLAHQYLEKWPANFWDIP